MHASPTHPHLTCGHPPTQPHPLNHPLQARSGAAWWTPTCRRRATSRPEATRGWTTSTACRWVRAAVCTASSIKCHHIPAQCEELEREAGAQPPHAGGWWLAVLPAVNVQCTKCQKIGCNTHAHFHPVFMSAAVTAPQLPATLWSIVLWKVRSERCVPVGPPPAVLLLHPPGGQGRLVHTLCVNTIATG